jgi:hypothetical protein
VQRVLIVVFALACALGQAAGATATAPPSTTTPAVTTTLTAATTTTTRSAASPSASNDDDEWTIRQLVVTGVAVIAALAFVGWVVAKVRNELAKPSAPKP